MTSTFQERVVLVQGASQGMGRETALALGRLGARVIVGARRAEGCAQVAREIIDAGGQAVPCPVDVTDAGSVARQFDAIERQFGRLDAAFNNVGATLGNSPTHETPLERFRATLDVNLVGTFQSMQHELRLMRAGGRGGAIVNTSSIGGVRGFAGIQDYCAAKWAVIGLSKSAALEYADQRIRINVIAPGLVATERFEQAREAHPAILAQRLAEIPMQHPGTMLDVAETVCWLLSDASRFITGEVLHLDGGECARMPC